MPDNINETLQTILREQLKKGYTHMTGYDIDNFNSREAIKRRIVLLREELTRLFKLL